MTPALTPDPMTEDAFTAEYARLAHAVQTGIAFEIQHVPNSDMRPERAVTSAKHLRTGLNCVMADVGSLGRLLIAKGVITQQEYFAAILDGMRQEVAAAEARAAEQLGRPVSLG